jgi:hypothetical protein
MTPSPSPSDKLRPPIYEGYCFRCKTRKTIQDATETRMKNGRPVVTGICITCGTKIWKLLPTSDAPR